MQRRKISIKVWKNQNKFVFIVRRKVTSCGIEIARKIKEGRIHASIVVEGGEPSQEKSSKEKDDQKQYLL